MTHFSQRDEALIIFPHASSICSEAIVSSLIEVTLQRATSTHLMHQKAFFLLLLKNLFSALVFIKSTLKEVFT